MDSVKKWNSFTKVTSYNELNKYMDYRSEKGHDKYWHYTDIDGLKGILTSKSLRLSPAISLNDKIEIQEIGNEDEQHITFVFSFTTGKNENLPMWYLYSGINGKGVRIEFSNKTINKIIDDKNLELEYDGRKITLIKEDYDLFFYDMIYYSKNGDRVDLKYNTMTNYQMSFTDFERYKELHRGFTKKIIWFFEKESRILIRLKGKRAKEIISFFRCERNNLKNAYIYLDIERYLESMRVMLAPEFIDKEELQKSETINDFMFHTSNIRFSSYKGQVKMNLCKKCEKREK